MTTSMIDREGKTNGNEMKPSTLQCDNAMIKDLMFYMISEVLKTLQVKKKLVKLRLKWSESRSS